MKILSLFDGMACGMLAMMEAGIKVDRYVAFEIDKYAVQTSSHNFPMIEHRGDVFQADFTEFSGFDFLVGGSPCTYWSIAQKNNRETEASGMGWELFSQYVRALKEAQPMYFIYENNKSMSKAIRESITETFGFEPICINSALVSAQNRQRLYWVGRRNLDGTYSRVKLEQPEDRGILLRDVLDGMALRDKGNALCGNRGGTCLAHDLLKSKHNYAAEPIKELSEREMDYMVRSTNGKYSDRWAYLQKPGENDKGLCITANISKGVPYNICAVPVRIPEYGAEDKARPLNALYPNNCGGFEHRMFSDNPNKQQVDMIAQPVELRNKITKDIDDLMDLCSDSEEIVQNCKDIKGLLGLSCYELDPQSVEKYGGFTSTRIGRIVAGDKGKHHDSQQYRVYSTEGKSVTLCSSPGSLGKMTGLYTVPLNETEDGKSQTIKAQYHFTSIPNICCYSSTYGATGVACPTDQPPSEQFTGTGKDMNAMKRVYEVKDGQITIKGKQYPIKLIDGCYIIRKLTVSECKRLQTVPEWYEFPVSDTQAYKMLGNGWTILIISHLIRATQTNEQDEGQLNIFEMAGELK